MTLAKVKNFIESSFRPAFAVQARELTQSQTILQNQIEKFGDHMFKQGSIVIPGGVAFDDKYYAVKLTSISSSNTLAQFTTGYYYYRWYFRRSWEIINTFYFIWF